MNAGFKCVSCSWIGEKPADKTVMKIKYKCCPDCRALVKPWIKPLNERAGRCGNCAGCSFKLKAAGGLYRKCDNCGEVIKTETMEVVTNGKQEFKYGENDD